MKESKFITFLCLLILCMGSNLYSQMPGNEKDILSRLEGSDGYFSNFRVEVDSMIADNYYKHILYNRKNVHTMGYRIRIFSGSGNDAFRQANEIRGRFLSSYEDISAYINYVAPDYKVYVGDCRTRSEVLKLFDKINEDFPYAFIVSHSINIKY